MSNEVENNFSSTCPYIHIERKIQSWQSDNCTHDKNDYEQEDPNQNADHAAMPKLNINEEKKRNNEEFLSLNLKLHNVF